MKRKNSHHLTLWTNFSAYLYWIFFFISLLLFGCGKPTIPEEKTKINPTVDSLDHYTNQIAIDPANKTALLKRAKMFYKRNAYDAALKDLRSSLMADSMQLDIYLLKSQIELDYFRSMEAIRTLQKAEKLWIHSPQVKEQLAKTHFILKQYVMARDKALEALKINPLSARANLILGMVAKENQDTTGAIKYLQEAVKNDADLLDAWIELAKMQMENNPKLAAPYFESALQIAPEDARIWHAYGMYWENQDSLAQAKNAFDMIIALDPHYVEAYYNKALILMDQDSFLKAIPLWDEYIRKSDDPVKGYYYRGISYEMSHNLPAALKNYQAAKELDPEMDMIDEAIQSINAKLN